MIIFVIKSLRRNRDSPYNHDIRRAFASLLSGPRLTLPMIWAHIIDLIVSFCFFILCN